MKQYIFNYYYPKKEGNLYMFYFPSRIKIAIANNINKTPIAIKIMHKILDIPKSLSGKLLCTVVVFADEELLLDVEVFVEFVELEFDEFVFRELLFVEFVEFDVLFVAFSEFVSFISISTADTVVIHKVNDRNKIHIIPIKNFFENLIIFFTSI